MPSSHLMLCRPLLLLPSIFPSIKVFSNESALHIRWPKYWSCSFNISPSNEHPGQISFRMDWLDLLAVQGTLESLLQHYSSKASIFWHSAFFIETLTREDILKCFPQDVWFVTGEVNDPPWVSSLWLLLRRNGVAIMVNKRVRNAVLGCNLKNGRMISVCFQGKPFNITVI